MSAQNVYNIKLVVIYVLPSDNKFIKPVIACYMFWLSLTILGHENMQECLLRF
jgi:hypothetical protein